MTESWNIGTIEYQSQKHLPVSWIMSKTEPTTSQITAPNHCCDVPHSQRRNLKSEDRRTAIIAAATTLFTEFGFEQTSLDMIIASSGGSKRAVYEHFGDKFGLLRAVAFDMIDQVLQPLFSEQIDEQDVRTSLQTIGRTFLLAMLSKPAIAVIKELIAQANKTPQLGAEIWQIGPARVQDQMAQYLERLSVKQVVAITDCHMASRQFFSLIKSDLHLKHLMEDDDEMDAESLNHHVEISVETFLKIIQ